MQSVAIELDTFSRRRRSTLLPHSTSGLTRGLEFGEEILLRAGDECWTARVTGLDFTLTDTIYSLELRLKVEPDDELLHDDDKYLRHLLAEFRLHPDRLAAFAPAPPQARTGDE